MDAAQLQDMRKRVLEGQPYTKEEFAQATKAMIGDRIAKAQAPTTKAKSVKKSLVDLDDLMV